MPCRDQESCDYYNQEERRKIMQDRIDAHAQKLCRVYTVLEKQSLHHLIPPEDRLWWENHKEFDRKRRKVEQESLKKRKADLERQLQEVNKKIR